MRISDWSSDVCSSDLGLAVDIALDVAAPQLADQREFVLQFDALGGGLHAQRFGERDDRLDDRGVAVAGDRRAAHERLVDLDLVERRFLQIAERRIAGAEIVGRSEENTSELPSLMRTSYAVFCMKKKTKQK